MDFFPKDELYKWLVNDLVQFEMLQFSSAWDIRMAIVGIGILGVLGPPFIE